MPSYDPNFFNINPYYDDFDESKKFLKLLFRPGYSLQARELSQIQSILQNQIERFGNFVLDDGSMVFGGQITEIPSKVVALSGLSGGGGIVVSELTDKVVTMVQSGGETSYAKIIHGVSDPITDEDVIYFQYISGEGHTGSVVDVQGFNTGLTFTASTSGDFSDGLVIFVDEGIRYTNGYFVTHGSQRIGVYEVGESSVDYETPSSSVGFSVNKSIITSEQDISLRDPASGFYNFNAPGSDRFKIDLVVSQRSLTASVDTSAVDPFSRSDFIEFVRVVDGDVVKKEKYADLGQIEETFARRTYDESGHYIVDPFEISMLQGPTATQLYSKLNSGKAYVFGYEFETMGSTRLIHDRARTSRDSLVDVQYGYSVGPYILGKFSGIADGASGLNLSNPPRILLDSFTGITSQQDLGVVNGVKFSAGLSATTRDFIPGLTLYFADNTADLTGGSSPGASAAIQAKILNVIDSNRYTSEGHAYVDYILIGPPYLTGNNWSGGVTSSFETTSPFYVAAGASFESGADITFTGSDVSFYAVTNEVQFTGGNISSQIGSARIRNIQKVSGIDHKLFLDDVSLNEGKSISDIRRMYVEGNTGNPAFYAYEIPVKTYNLENTSLVFESPFAEVVKNIDQYDFMVDVVLENQTFSSGSWTTTLSFNGLVQIGPNISTSEIFYNLNSSRVVTVYSKDGKIDGEVRINGGDDPKVITIQNATLNGSEFNGTATVIVSCMVGSIAAELSESRSKIEATASVGLTSFTGPDDQGYYYSYFKVGGNNLTDVFEVSSISPTLPGYIFDNGQRDTYYDFARIKVSSLPSEGYTADIRYYTHSGYGPFAGGLSSGAIGSYPNYEEIPNYTSYSGKTLSLRNSLDFRPVRYGNETTFSLTGPYQYPTFVYDGYEHSVDYSYYLPRIDKIVLTRDKQFEIIRGIPSENPVVPADSPNAMTLYTIRFNPYTFNEDDVTIVQEDNRRFTMKDIGNLERRIEKLEYYSTLSLLEQEAKNSPIYDDLGLEIPKKALLVDQFTGTESSDVGNPDFYCSVNRETKELRPPYTLTNVGYESTIVIPSGLTNNAGIVTFNFTEEEFVANKKYNSSRYINSNAIVDFNGTIKLNPHCDSWFSLTKTPMIKSNFDGENDSWLIGSLAFSMNANFWDYNWFGKNASISSVNRKNTTLVKNYKQKPLSTGKIGTFTIPQSNIKSTPERIVDSTVVPYCREKTISLTSTGLKPNKVHYVYFDDQLISSGITSSSRGELSYSLTVTGDTYVSGKKLVRILDNNTNDLSSSTSSADAIYTVSGITKDADSSGYVRPLITRRESSNSENITNDVLTREFQRKNAKSKYSKENLSQIFSIRDETYPQGVFVKSVSLYFSAWPTSSDFEKDFPVKLMLKPVVNGYPSPSKIIAESSVYDIDTSGTLSSNEEYSLVTFEFDHPIYLQGGDYALELESNSSQYAVKTYLLPSVNIPNSVERESVVDTAIENLILPKNVGKTEKLNNEILTFVLNRCSFSGSATNLSYTGLTLNYPSEIRSHVEGCLIDPRYCSITYNSVTYSPNTSDKIKDSTTSSTLFVNLSPINQFVSPAYDVRASNFVFTTHVSSANTVNELLSRDSEDTLVDTTYRNTTKSRYITKTVNTLQTATNVSVTFDKNQPPETDIKVYLKKTEPNSSVSFDDAEYIELLEVSRDINPVKSDDFVKTEYRYPINLPEFNTFAVKIVFTSPSDSNRYPSIKNLRVVAI